MCAENGSTLRRYRLKWSFQSVKYNVLPCSVLPLPEEIRAPSGDHLLLLTCMLSAPLPFCISSHGPSWAKLPQQSPSLHHRPPDLRGLSLSETPDLPQTSVSHRARTRDCPGTGLPRPYNKWVRGPGLARRVFPLHHKPSHVVRCVGCSGPQRAGRCISAVSTSASLGGDETKRNPEILPNKAKGKWEHTARRWKPHYEKFGFLFFFKISFQSNGSHLHSCICHSVSFLQRHNNFLSDEEIL